MNKSRQLRSILASGGQSLPVCVLSALVVAAGLTGCSVPLTERAPSSPDQLWRPAVVDLPGGSKNGYSLEQGLPAVAALGQLPDQDLVLPSHPLALPELIDLAQRHNPHTRQAWNHARQAALAVGLVEATFLPMLSANVIGGFQRTQQSLPLQVGGIRSFDTEVNGVVPALAVGWLLFDFGQRDALLEGASQLSFAANVLFNAVHQKVIRDVTDQFYHYNTARSRVDLARESLGHNQTIEHAVNERLKAGVATTLERALARQAVAQARLYLVESEGLERNAWLGLLSALGLSPKTRIQIATVQAGPLPASLAPLTSERIGYALTRRPDLVAGYAAMRAAQANERAAEAEFMPKVYLGAVAANSRLSFDVRGLPGLSQTTSSSGVLLGVTLPLFDGGLRQTRLRDARIRTEEARQNLETRQRTALREIVAAESLLQSALQSTHAATELVATAETAHDAALEAYRNGVGTLPMTLEATNGLLKARQARSDARNATLAAAANLAFVMGELTSTVK